MLLVEMIGSHIVQSVAGAPQASRAVARETRRVEAKAAARARDEDVVDVPVTEVDEADAVRRTGANGDEESREDRQESGFYEARATRKDAKGENLDLSA